MSDRRPALIETVRIRNGEAPLWGLHLARLFRACRAIGVPPPLELDTPSGGEDRVERFVVSAAGIERTASARGSVDPVRLATSPIAHSPYPHKVTDRVVFEEARRLARAGGADDAVLLVAGGWVAETAIWGLYWWEDGELCAPPMDFGILASVARARIDAMVGGIAERRVTPAELAARAPFVANAARGVVSVRSLDRRAVASRPETSALAAAFWT